MTISKPEKKLDNTYGDYWSGKKPYLVHDYREMMQQKTQEEYYFHELASDPMSELYRPYLYDDDVEPGMGWEYMSPSDTPWPGWDPPVVYPPGGGDCQLACNPSMLDCKGGCTKIACICGGGILSASVKSDPTGGMIQIADASPSHVTVCLNGDPGDLGEEYPKAVISVSGIGGSVDVEVALVDCLDCCEDFEITGAATVNPGATWTGTISPACPGATCEVSSNSGCSLSCSVNGAGSQVTVTPGASDCGSFTVTVSDGTGDACSASASAVVRINNTGQGGAWSIVQSNLGGGCQGANCTFGSYTYNHSPITNEQYKYGLGINCQNDWTQKCYGVEGCADDGTPPPGSSPESCDDKGTNCSGSPCDGGARTCCDCNHYNYSKCEWICSC